MRRGFVISMLALVTAAAVAPAPAVAGDAEESMRQTIQVVRETGTRLYAYMRGWADGSGAETGAGAEEATTYDWSACEPVGPEELARMIGGDGSAIVDGWGNALEVCIALDNLASGRHVIGVRSAGGDGAFAGPRYGVGAFDEAARPAADVVWMDGYFVTWPQARQ